MARDDTRARAAPRAGRVAIVGRPNVGKSTLLNALVGTKLAITARKPQTTRTCILGVGSWKRPPVQIAFVDTPGVHRPATALGRAIVEEAKAGLAGVDAIVLVTDVSKELGPATPLPAGDEEVLRALDGVASPIVLAINKVDRVKDKARLLPYIERWSARRAFAALVPISASRQQNLDGLVGALAPLLPEGVLYEEDFLTDRPMRFLAAELVREAAIELVREEVPHSIAVLVEEYVEEPKLVRIRASIVVEKDGQKGIVIGKRGAMLKEIGTAARERIEKLVGRRVFLELWVKVEEGWTRDPNRVRRVLGETRT